MPLISLLAAAAMASPLPEEVSTAETAGVVLRFESGDGVDHRRQRLAALRVEAGAAPTPFLEPGPFRVVLSGELHLDIRSRLQFRILGRGAARLRVGDELLLETEGEDLSIEESESARIGKGANPLVLEYESPADGPAWFRLEWAGRRFEWEPVPPDRLHLGAAADEALAAAEQLRQGRRAFADRRCARCHALPAELQGPLAMPELGADAPKLEDSGWRLRPRWMAEWILDPGQLRPQHGMPRLLPHLDLAAADAAGDSTVRDLVAYLAGRSTASPEAATALDPARAEAGGALFADLGCIACHLLPSAEGPDASGHDRLPLSGVRRKWTPAGLVDFLLAPNLRYHWIRMPDFQLAAEEAQALASFLWSEAPAAEDGDFALGDAARGETRYAELGCANCHESDASRHSALASACLELGTEDAKGCLAAEAEAPRWGLADDERDALLAFLREGLASLGRHSPLEFAVRQVDSLQCNACHSYDDVHDRWNGLDVEAQHLAREHEGHVIDQSRPQLTWVGEKLHSPAIEALLDGSVERRARPWLHARMPAFPHRAAGLTTGLAAQHGLGRSTPAVESIDEDEHRIGSLLLTKEGFGCTGCHDIGAERTAERFEFQTPNLDLTHERIRPDYFARWMYNPLRVEPSSKMPRYADDDGGSPYSEYYEGDIARQYEAIRRTLANLRD